MKRKLLAILCTVLMVSLMFPLSVFATVSFTTVIVDGLKYEIYNGTATVIGYTSEMPANVVVPPVVDGCPVTAIGYGAFTFCDQLCSIVIPASITSIGGSSHTADTYASTLATCPHLSSITVAEDNTAFTSQDGVLFNKNMTRLEQYPSNKAGDYSIPDGVQIIRPGAFYRCDNLTSLYIPDSVISITNTTMGVVSKGREGSIYSCKNIVAFTVSENNSCFSSQDGVLFNDDKTRLILYPPQKQDSHYSIPNTVTSIDSWAFDGCPYLISVVIPNNVHWLSDFTFCCSALTSITMSLPVIYISENAIRACITDVYYAAPKWDEDSAGIYDYQIKRIGLQDATWHFDCIEPEDRYSSNVQNSVMDTENGNGLAFRFELNANGVAVKNGIEVDLTNATVRYGKYDYKLVKMGVVLSNRYSYPGLHYVNGEDVLDVPIVYLQEVDDDSCAFAARIINIPDAQLERTIYARPYYIVEVDGEEIVVYGNVDSASCAEFM